MNYNNHDIRLRTTAPKPRTAQRRNDARSAKIKPASGRNALRTAAAAIALAAGAAHAQFVIQPNEAASKDAKTYGFLPTFNLQSNLGVTGSDFNTVEDGNHQFRSLLQFDLSTIPLLSSDVSLATLELWVTSIDTTSGGGPGDVALHEITATWTETGVTWDTFPAFDAPPVDTEFVGTAGQWITFDVTSSIIDWLNTPSSNNGWAIIPDAPVNLFFADADGVTGAAPDPTKAPRLTVVPEPGSAFLVLAGAAVCGIRRRRSTASA